MKNEDGLLGLVKDVIIVAGCVAASALVVRGVSNNAFERGKKGEKPTAYPDANLQEVAQGAYKAGQMKNISESIKKIADK